MKNSRVIIVDDDSDLRESLNAWLSQDYLVEAFDSAESFLLAIKDFNFEDGIPTCIALDFKMPGMNGVELQKILKEINVEFPIIFMSGNALQADVIDAWQEGAVNFILKPFAASKISDAIQRLFTTVSQQHKNKRDAPDKTSNIELPINQREAQVLLLLGKGCQQYEVAEILGLSLRTVKMYRASIKEKLQLHTLMELGRYYDKHQLSIEKIAKPK
jgi:FixJ family two-component response regulator